MREHKRRSVRNEEHLPQVRVIEAYMSDGLRFTQYSTSDHSQTEYGKQHGSIKALRLG